MLASTAQAGSCSSETRKDIVATAAEAGSFGTLLAAAEAAGLVEALQGDGPLTVFAPTDEAFSAIPQETLQSLLRPENRDALTAILTYHVVPQKLTAEDVIRLDRVKTLNGQSLDVSAARSTVRLDDATVVATDILASNGIIHVIDRVLMPEVNRASASPARELIRRAFDRGVPLYNDGQAAACAAIYEVAALSLVSLDAEELNDRSVHTLRNALERTGSVHDASRRAWVLREALDSVLVALNSGDEGRSMPMTR